MYSIIIPKNIQNLGLSAIMGASNKKLFMFCESLCKMFFKLSFGTFALKFTNLVIKFQITGPLY